MTQATAAFERSDTAERRKEGLALIKGPLWGNIPSRVEFYENDIQFSFDPLEAQKTGFFLDQRENRQRVRALAHGKKVLNAFSFNGGFSLYAAQGGAREVVSVDISRHALESSVLNFALNPQLTVPHQPVQADVFDYLRQTEAQYDLVILDPPSFARREKERAGAIRAYGRLAQLGIQRLAHGGVLLCASCSAHGSATEFWDVVRAQAKASKRQWRVLETTQHACDHPARFAEAQYLKAIYLQFEG